MAPPSAVPSSLKDVHAFRNALLRNLPRMSRTSILPKRLQPMLATLTDAPFACGRFWAKPQGFPTLKLS
jgi:hypothetical protein